MKRPPRNTASDVSASGFEILLVGTLNYIKDTGDGIDISLHEKRLAKILKMMQN